MMTDTEKKEETIAQLIERVTAETKARLDKEPKRFRGYAFRMRMKRRRRKSF